MTFGGTWGLREEWGINDQVNPNSWYYASGEVTGAIDLTAIVLAAFWSGPTYSVAFNSSHVAFGINATGETVWFNGIMGAEGGIAVDEFFATQFANSEAWMVVSEIPAPTAASALAWAASHPVASSCLAAALTAFGRCWGMR